MKTLIGHEYEVRVEHLESGTIDGWFRAKYLTPRAREMGWLWEIEDPRFVRLRLEEVRVVAVRPAMRRTRKRGWRDENFGMATSNKFVIQGEGDEEKN